MTHAQKIAAIKFTAVHLPLAVAGSIVLALGMGTAASATVNSTSVSFLQSNPTSISEKIDDFAYGDDTEDLNLYRAYEAGSMLSFAKISGATDQWLSGYLDYQIDGQDRIYPYLNTGFTTSIQCAASDHYDRDALMTKIIKTYGTDTADTPEETIADTYDRVRAKMFYADDYTNVPLIEAIDDGYGVCWHFSRIAYVLLNAEGIQTRMVSGRYYGGAHAWDECCIDGEWVYVDMTNWRGIVPESELPEYDDVNLVY